MEHHEHSHCCCHFKEQLSKFKAGKLGLFGGFLIIAHLLFHVAECLILPAAFVAFHHRDVEAVGELDEQSFQETTFITHYVELQTLKIDFPTTLITYALPY